MDQDTKQAAIDLLTSSRRAYEEHEVAGRDISLGRYYIVTAARSHGMTWDEIAHHIGWSDGHSLRMWHRRFNILGNV